MIPPAEKYFRWGTQSRRLYDFLACGPATGDQIVRQTRIVGYQKKISEIRTRIAGTGVTSQIQADQRTEKPLGISPGDVKGG